MKYLIMYKLLYTILLRIEENKFIYRPTFYLFLLINYPDTYPLSINVFRII